jgi:hypothetical protein
MTMLASLPCFAKAEKSSEGAIPIALSFPQGAIADINTVYIPFTLLGQLIMVEATVDTLTGLFILDTGSERLVVNKQHYSPKPQSMPVVAAGNTGLVSGALGTHVDSARIQFLVMRNLYAHVVDLGHIETKKNTRIAGILGYDVFKSFELFIDFPNRRIVLFRLNAKGDKIEPGQNLDRPHDSLSFTLKKHLIQVDAVVNAVKVKFILDSGAELNLIDRRINRKVLDKFTIIKRVNLAGVGKREVEVLAGVLNDVRVGNQVNAKMNTLLTSLDHINNAFGTQADGVIGYEFLKSRRTLINYTKRKIYFFNPVRS